MEQHKIKRPGSVRLTEDQYQEMELMGFDSESAYVKHKLSQAKQHLKVISHSHSHNVADRQVAQTSPITSLDNKRVDDPNDLNAALVVQRLDMENKQLQEKLEQLSQVKDQALNGVHQQVGNLLKEELQRRDFDQLKKTHATQLKELDKLEVQLKKTQGEVESKEEEIKSLLKQLSFVELGKVLLPGAISGLAKRFPTQMQGLASTLGAITDGSESATPGAINEEQQNLLQIAEYFRALFDEQQFEKLVQLVIQMGATIKSEPELFKKVSYYLNKLQAKPAEQQTEN